MPLSKRARLILANDGEHDYSEGVACGVDYDEDDYTGVAFWYQAEPHQASGLPSFKERTATGNASEK